jgi:glycosyltransferase involved in cell wall biosynthesis
MTSQETAAPCTHVLPDTDDAGAETQALYLLEGLSASNAVQPELAYFEPGRGHERFVELGVPMHRLERRRRFLFDYGARAARLRSAYGDRQPAILHSWLFEANCVALTAARHWPGTRVVIAQRSSTMERRMRGHMMLMRRLYPHADRALANSPEGAELLVDLGVERSRVVVVPQGVPDERIAVYQSPDEVRTELGVPAHGSLVVAVGRADDTKDWPTMFAAMEHVWQLEPQCTLALVGPTADEIASLGVELPDRARAVGWQKSAASFMKAADVVAISSWTEGNSNVAGEALRLGVPVACTETGAHPAIVAETGGRTVPIRRPDLLGRALIELLDDPPARDEVRAVATRRLSTDASFAATLDVYRDLLSGEVGSSRATDQASTTASRSWSRRT